MLRGLADDLWVADQPHRYLGIEVGARMTVIRLAGGALLIHSPIRLTDDLREAITRAGQVRFIIAPNRFHHLFVAQWQKAYPEAKSFCAPGLQTKRSDLHFDSILGDKAEPEWAGEVDQIWMRSFPPLNEIVMLHRRSRTLIFTDLLFNLRDHQGGFGRFLLQLDGAFGGPAVPRSFKLLLRYRRAETAALMRRLLAWDFDRVIVTHGDIIDRGGRKAVESAWRFALATNIAIP